MRRAPPPRRGRSTLFGRCADPSADCRSTLRGGDPPPRDSGASSGLGRPRARVRSSTTLTRRRRRRSRHRVARSGRRSIARARALRLFRRRRQIGMPSGVEWKGTTVGGSAAKLYSWAPNAGDQTQCEASLSEAQTGWALRKFSRVAPADKKYLRASSLMVVQLFHAEVRRSPVSFAPTGSHGAGGALARDRHSSRRSGSRGAAARERSEGERRKTAREWSKPRARRTRDTTRRMRSVSRTDIASLRVTCRMRISRLNNAKGPPC